MEATFEVDKTIVGRSISCVLNNMILRNKNIYCGWTLPVTSFNASIPPPIKIFDYIERFRQHALCSDEVLIVALIYIDIIIQNGFILSELNVHRILLATIVVSCKFLEDECYKNDFFAKVGGVSLHELNSLELEVLKLMKFRLKISPHIFSQMSDGLAKHPSVLDFCSCFKHFPFLQSSCLASSRIMHGSSPLMDSYVSGKSLQHEFSVSSPSSRHVHDPLLKDLPCIEPFQKSHLQPHQADTEQSEGFWANIVMKGSHPPGFSFPTHLPPRRRII
mmetsp:Transcript_21138/g.27431  ORF Transcript_21138/g.27431 Transcript_21138/m.27431 type:complete len:276 (-) Transcript_21138:265-1092(-)